VSEPGLSVVLCTYNRADSLAVALDSVLQQEIPGVEYEVVVVNDGSTDHTADVVEAAAARAAVTVRMVTPPSKNGIAHARNTGIRAAAAPATVFFDDDQLADPGWLNGLLAVAAEKGTEMVGGPRRLDLPEEVVRTLGPVCRGLLGENLYPPVSERLDGKELPTTGNLFFTKALFERLDGFDEALRASGEDADFVRRARKAGVEVWTAPAAMVAHMVPAYRTTPAYFRWVSHRWGIQFAAMDLKERGKARLLLNAALRGAQALAMHLPRLAVARLGGNAPLAIDARALLWRAEGYIRSALRELSPGLFGQQAFFDGLDFRNEREMFADDGAGAETGAAAGKA